SFPIYESCIPGRSWKEDCNTCFCGYDGYTAFCTLKDCDEDTSHSGNEVEEDENPKDSYEIDCIFFVMIYY
ncbi:hypothetical protein L9F63_006171, partial [Diploptera punctata]